ncbi:MAG: polyprenyl synthetase family protein [Phycisphaerales bacterium]|nr:polyprenyl synthetase family protein [Phycisphaerales bacterium]
MSQAEDSRDALGILQQDSRLLADYFKQILSRYPDAPPRLMESIEYSLMAGGKRLRPALVLECCRACGGDRQALTSALASAAAMELIHTFSLVHDDLPAMDNDDLRRGRPTNHKVFGDAMAILAGDAMTTMAFQVLATDTAAPVAAALVRELSSASGPEGMIGGQVLDMEGENISLSLEQLQRLHRMKTGALLKASCRMGAIAAGANEKQLSAVTDYGRHLGLAFQIVDDVLDVTSTPEQMGKATGKDAAKGKNTYPVLLGLDPSKREAAIQLQAGIQALAPLGPAADGLRSLARFVVEREN